MDCGNIFIEAGHGGADPGAVANGYNERDLCVELRDLIVQKIRQIKNYSGKVFTDDDGLTLWLTIGEVNRKCNANDRLISLHFNASVSPLATGTEVWVATNTSDKNRRFAKNVCNFVSDVLGINNRGVKNSTDNRHGRLGILDDTRPRAILLEVAFISNKVDMSRYQQNKERLAGTLAQLLVMDVNGNSAIKD